MYRLFFLTMLGLSLTSSATADQFGSGPNSFDIEFVTIGDPGNPADSVASNTLGNPLPSGTVDYIYRIAKYEITEDIVAKVNTLSGDMLNVQLGVERGPQKPATGLSWFDAARFVNWLNEDQGSPLAYKFDEQNQFQLWEPSDVGYNPGNPFRNTQARYFLPSADEWHKAAYYDPMNERYWLFPYGSDDPPIAVANGPDPGTAVFNQSGPADVTLAGGESPFGTVGQGGNAWEWEETEFDLVNDSRLSARVVRGGFWNNVPSVSSSSIRLNVTPSIMDNSTGLRVASIPEPHTLLVAATAAFLSLLRRNRRPVL